MAAGIIPDVRSISISCVLVDQAMVICIDAVNCVTHYCIAGYCAAVRGIDAGNIVRTAVVPGYGTTAGSVNTVIAVIITGVAGYYIAVPPFYAHSAVLITGIAGYCAAGAGMNSFLVVTGTTVAGYCTGFAGIDAAVAISNYSTIFNKIVCAAQVYSRPGTHPPIGNSAHTNYAIAPPGNAAIDTICTEITDGSVSDFNIVLCADIYTVRSRNRSRTDKLITIQVDGDVIGRNGNGGCNGIAVAGEVIRAAL